MYLLCDSGFSYFLIRLVLLVQLVNIKEADFPFWRCTVKLCLQPLCMPQVIILTVIFARCTIKVPVAGRVAW